MAKDKEVSTDFTEFFSGLSCGDANHDASREFAKLLSEQHEVARLQGKAKGEITIKIQFVTEENLKTDIGYSIKTTMPKRKTPGSVAWVKANGTLVDADPRQGVIEYKSPAANQQGFKDPKAS